MLQVSGNTLQQVEKSKYFGMVFMAPMAKFKCAPLHINLNIRYMYNFYES